MLDGAVAFERPALEDRRFGSAFGFWIVGFEREQERVIGIAREGLEVLFQGQRPMPAHETVVGAVEQLSRFENAIFWLVVELSLEDEPDGVPDRKHSAHARRDGF